MFKEVELLWPLLNLARHSHIYTVTVVSTAVDHCHGQDIDAWRCYGMETPSTKLALCEGNPPVTGGFQSQKASDVEF